MRYIILGFGLSATIAGVLVVAAAAPLSGQGVACPATGERPLALVQMVFVEPAHEEMRAAASLPRLSADEIDPLVGPESAPVCAQLLRFVRTVYPPQERAWHGSFFAAGDLYIVVQWAPDDAEAKGEAHGHAHTSGTRNAIYLLDSSFTQIAAVGI